MSRRAWIFSAIVAVLVVILAVNIWFIVRSNRVPAPPSCSFETSTTTTEAVVVTLDGPDCAAAAREAARITSKVWTSTSTVPISGHAQLRSGPDMLTIFTRGSSQPTDATATVLLTGLLRDGWKKL
jgi:hypothetical protein